MRYTTIIDISEEPAVYRNVNTRLLYLHLALKSGYHDDDRDRVDISIRRLSFATGLTVSATRHALKVLERCQLLTREGSTWTVKKWVLDTKPTPRRQSNTAKSDVTTTQLVRQSELDENERVRRLDAWFANAGKEELQNVLARLETGKPVMVNGCRMYPSERAKEAIRTKLKRL